jgi:SAM-dependent methyltransferase
VHEHAYDAVRRMRPVAVEQVYEVGSLDICGSVRPLFADAKTYHGIDLVAGDGVDAVGDGATYVPPFEPDCVVCCEVLEHAPNARQVVEQMARVLKPGGTLVVTCAGPGRYPHSAVDGGKVRDGEYYRGLPAQQLADWMCEAGLASGRFESGQGVPEAAMSGRQDADSYVIGVKPCA